MKLNAALILRGGLAKGYGALALLRFLEERDLQVKVIVGSSSGAQVAALHGLGWGWQEILEDVSSFQMKETSSLWSLVSRGYLFADKKINAFYDKHIPREGFRIEECQKRIGFIATRKHDGTPKLLHTGDLKKTLLASTAAPLVIAPENLGGELLYDGDLAHDYMVDEIKNTFAVENLVGVRNDGKNEKSPIGLFVDFYFHANEFEKYEKLGKSGRDLNYEIVYPSMRVGHTHFKKIPQLVERTYEFLLTKEQEILQGLGGR